MKKYRKYIIMIVVIIAAVIAINKFREAKKAPEWRTDTASVGSVREIVTATGSLNPYVLVEVGTEVSGKIEKLYKDFNDTVKKGELLAKLDTEILRTSLEASKSDLAKATTSLAEAKLDLDLQSELFRKNMTPEYELRKAEFKYQNAQQNVATAQLSLQRAQKNLDNAYITSPINGIIVSRDVDEGQTVAASLNSPTLFLIANNLDRMQITAGVDEADIGKIKVGMPVEFNVDAHPMQRFSGSVQQIRLNPTNESNVVSYSVIIDAENPERLLLPGMTTNVTFIVQAKEGITRIPELATRFRPSKEVWELFGLKWDEELLNAGSKLREEAMSKMKQDAKAPEMVKSSVSPDSSKTKRSAKGASPMEARSGVRLGGGSSMSRSALVWILKDNEPTPVLVKTGVSDGAFVELIEGLDKNAVLVTGVIYKDPKQAANNNSTGSPGMRRF
ncbi:MAG TPA: efflux RND transporter periplasmic adaptor subunit [Candidatus Cloacimonadota bacterium]|nr:efflux RND transporter periplasmic adaptor subunit [Candidatus Cloacimonadota bacterium]